jgi:hypothetical protein
MNKKIPLYLITFFIFAAFISASQCVFIWEDSSWQNKGTTKAFLERISSPAIFESIESAYTEDFLDPSEDLLYLSDGYREVVYNYPNNRWISSKKTEFADSKTIYDGKLVYSIKDQYYSFDLTSDIKKAIGFEKVDAMTNYMKNSSEYILFSDGNSIISTSKPGKIISSEEHGFIRIDAMTHLRDNLLIAADCLSVPKESISPRTLYVSEIDSPFPLILIISSIIMILIGIPYIIYKKII